MSIASGREDSKAEPHVALTVPNDPPKTSLTNHNNHSVELNIDDGLSVRVPENFTFKTYVNRSPVHLLMFYPVKDVDGMNYDALSVLLGLDSRCPNNTPVTLTFNHALYAEIKNHFHQVAAEHKILSDGLHSKAKTFVATAINDLNDDGFLNNTHMARDIQKLAQYNDVEIIHENPGTLPSIAMSKNPKFGPIHRNGMLSSAVSVSLMQAINALFSSNLDITTWDYITVPLIGLITTNSHATTTDCKKLFTSMNHRSLPTTLLYTAAGTGAYAVNYFVKGVVISKMTAAGVASAGVTTVSFFLPIGVAATAACVYHYGPRVGSCVIEKAVQVATGLKDCVYGIGGLFKACGSRLWGSAPGQPADGPGPGADAKASLLPSPLRG